MEAFSTVVRASAGCVWLDRYETKGPPITQRSQDGGVIRKITHSSKISYDGTWAFDVHWYTGCERRGLRTWCQTWGSNTYLKSFNSACLETLLKLPGEFSGKHLTKQKNFESYERLLSESWWQFEMISNLHGHVSVYSINVFNTRAPNFSQVCWSSGVCNHRRGTRCSWQSVT